MAFAAVKHPEIDLACVIKSLLEAEESDGGVLTLDLDPIIGFDFGIPLFREEKTVKFYIREEYIRIWGLIESKYDENCRRKFTVTGTAGIGKSLFRFYVLRRFLKFDLSLTFERVIMNFEKEYFMIDQTGNAVQVGKDEIIYKESLALLDQCDILNGVAKLRAKLTILQHLVRC